VRCSDASKKFVRSSSSALLTLFRASAYDPTLLCCRNGHKPKKTPFNPHFQPQTSSIYLIYTQDMHSKALLKSLSLAVSPQMTAIIGISKSCRLFSMPAVIGLSKSCRLLSFSMAATKRQRLEVSKQSFRVLRQPFRARKVPCHLAPFPIPSNPNQPNFYACMY
jgi:hypothetical protein